MFSVAGSASAHTDLIGVDPGEGSTVAEGSTVTLTFSEAVLTIGAEATVTDAAGTVTALTVTFPTEASWQVALPALAEGAVTLAWRVVADDGHPIEGSLAFVAAAPVAPTSSSAPTPTPAPTQSSTPSPSATPLVIAPAPSADAQPSGSSGGGLPVALWVAIGAALLATSAAIIAAKRKR